MCIVISWPAVFPTARHFLDTYLCSHNNLCLNITTPQNTPHRTATNNTIAATPAIMANSPVAIGAAPVLRVDELVKDALDARL